MCNQLSYYPTQYRYLDVNVYVEHWCQNYTCSRSIVPRINKCAATHINWQCCTISGPGILHAIQEASLYDSICDASAGAKVPKLLLIVICMALMDGRMFGWRLPEAHKGTDSDNWDEPEDIRPLHCVCLLYTSPSPRDRQKSRMPSSA